MSGWDAPSSSEQVQRMAGTFWGIDSNRNGSLVHRNKCILNLLGLSEATLSRGGGLMGTNLLGGSRDTTEEHGLIERLNESPRSVMHDRSENCWSMASALGTVKRNCENSSEDHTESSYKCPGEQHIAHITSGLSCLSESFSGPTGALQGNARAHYVYTYSTTSSTESPVGFTILNENNEQGDHVAMSAQRGAIFLHVNNRLCFTDPASPLGANNVMEAVSDEMEEVGLPWVQTSVQPADLLSGALMQ